MLQDIRFAARLLFRQRGFLTTAVLTIALGVGLSATVFAVVDGVLFRPLPYRDASRLVAMYGAARAERQFTMPISAPDLVDWRAASRTFEQIEAYDMGRAPARVRGVEESLQAPVSAVTPGFFQMLGAHPALGRAFAAEDFESGASPVAIISHRLWRGAFGGDPEVLGRTVGIGAIQHTVIGVMPRAFVFPTPSRRFAPDVLLPFDPAGRAGDRASRLFYAIGRLAAGAEFAQAQAEIDAIALRLKPLYNGPPNLIPGAFDGATLIDLRYHLTRASRGALWLVFGAVAAVFLISCVNVVGLLLAHGEDRKRELAVRAAIGAGRWTLMRQLLAEAGLLAAIGTAAGWLLSLAAFGIVVRQLPRWLQLIGEPRLDGRAAAFAAALGLLTVVFAGVVPALRASASAPRYALAAGPHHSTGARRGRHALILVEVALATVLLCAGSIMLRGWVRLHAQDSGMDADRVIAVRSVPAAPSDAAGRARHNVIMSQAIARVPGVTSVAFTDMPLLQRAIKGSGFVPPARVPHPAGMDTDVTVTANYFATVGIKLRLGRGLVAADRGRGVVITEALQRRYWPGRNPVGETIRYRNGTREIVGVVNDTRDVSLDGPPVPTLYHVWDEANPSIATMVVRFSGPAAAVMSAIRRAVRTADDTAPITMLSTVEDLLSVSVAERNFNTLLFATFGVAGVLVALVGIYGLVAVVVARREREMGIRLALGANTRGLKVFIISGTLRWIAGGVVLGIGGALLGAQYLGPFVYQVPANDPLTLSAVALVFLTVAVVASYLPARRAARVDPMITLRAE